MAKYTREEYEAGLEKAKAAQDKDFQNHRAISCKSHKK